MDPFSLNSYKECDDTWILAATEMNNMKRSDAVPKPVLFREPEFILARSRRSPGQGAFLKSQLNRWTTCGGRTSTETFKTKHLRPITVGTNCTFSFVYTTPSISNPGSTACGTDQGAREKLTVRRADRKSRNEFIKNFPVKHQDGINQKFPGGAPSLCYCICLLSG